MLALGLTGRTAQLTRMLLAADGRAGNVNVIHRSWRDSLRVLVLVV